MRKQDNFFTKISKTFSLLLALMLTTFQTPVSAQQKAPLHAHVHGQAQLQLAIDQTQVVMSFSSPLDNFLGFERAPKDEAEQEKVRRLLQQLQNPLIWFELNDAAHCQIKQIDIDAPALTDNLKSTEDKKHGDLRFEIDLQCKNPHHLRSLRALVHQQYKGIKRIKIEVVHGAEQYRKTLQSDDTILAW